MFVDDLDLCGSRRLLDLLQVSSMGEDVRGLYTTINSLQELAPHKAASAELHCASVLEVHAVAIRGGKTGAAAQVEGRFTTCHWKSKVA